MDDEMAALAYQEELEHQQWYEEWSRTDEFVDFVNDLIYDILSTT